MKKYFVILIAILLCICIMQFFHNRVILQRLKKATDTNTENQKTQYYESHIGALSSLTKNYQRDFDSIVVKDSLAREVRLAEVIGTTPKLVLKFSEEMCDLCYAGQIEKLKLLSTEIGTENIILLVAFKGANDIKLLKKTYKIPFNIYNCTKSRLQKAPLDRYSAPYYFLINTKGEFSNYFLTERSLPELTNFYFDQIKEVFKEEIRNTYNNARPSNTEAGFANDSINLGIVKPDAILLSDVTIFNNGPEDLFIYDVSTSCGCIKVRWPLYSVRKSATATIQTKIIVDLEPGAKFIQTVRLVGNLPDKSRNLVFYGEVTK